MDRVHITKKIQSVTEQLHAGRFLFGPGEKLVHFQKCIGLVPDSEFISTVRMWICCVEQLVIGSSSDDQLEKLVEIQQLAWLKEFLEIKLVTCQ